MTIRICWDEVMTFDDVLIIKNGKNQRAVENPDGKYPIYGSGGIMGYADDYICEADTVIVGRKGSINNPIFVEEPFWNVDTAFGLVAKREVLLPRYLYYFCRNYDFERLNKAVTIPSLTKSDLLKIEITLPSLEIQEKIVNKLLKIEEVIQARQQQLQKLDELVKARFVELFGDPMTDLSKWSASTIGEQFNVASGGTPATGEKAYWENGTIPWIGSNMCQDTMLSENDGKFITEEGYAHSSTKWFHKGTVLVALVGATIGKTALLRFDTTTNQNIAAIDVTPNAAFSSEFVFYHMQMLYSKFMEIGSGKFKMANQGFIRQLPLICPPMELQEQFAAFVEQTDKSKVAVQKALDEAQLLFDSLMQKYFG